MIEKVKQNEKYDPEKLEKLCAKELLALTFHPDKNGQRDWRISFFFFFYWTLSTNYCLIHGTCRAGLNKNLCSTWSLTEIDFSIQFLFKMWNSNTRTNNWHATTVIHILALLNALSWWWYKRQLIKVKVKNIKKQDFAIVFKTRSILSRFMGIQKGNNIL